MKKKYILSLGTQSVFFLCLTPEKLENKRKRVRPFKFSMSSQKDELLPPNYTESFVLTGEMKDTIAKRVAEKSVQVGDGHLVLQKPDLPCPAITLWNGRKFPLYASIFFMTTNDTSILADSKFLLSAFHFEKCCAVPHCIGHHVPITSDLISPIEMSHYDHAYFMQVFETHTRRAEGSDKTNYHDSTISIGHCILWTGSCDKKGYGQCNYLGTRRAHVFSYKLWHLENVPTGYLVRHKCLRRKNCVNPEHLEMGTAKQNGEDRKRDGTAKRGTQHVSKRRKKSEKFTKLVEKP